jgi:hypothetical protein
MSDRWQCPKCKRSHESRYTFGGVQARAANGMVMRAVNHADVVCACGERISGKEIAAGLHDKSDLPFSPMATAIIGSLVAGLFFGGVAHVWARLTFSIVIGGFFTMLHLFLFMSGQLVVKPDSK